MKHLLERLAELAPDVCVVSNNMFRISALSGTVWFVSWDYAKRDKSTCEAVEARILHFVLSYCESRGWNSVFLFIDETGHCCDIVDADTDVETGHESYTEAALSALIKALEALNG